MAMVGVEGRIILPKTRKYLCPAGFSGIHVFCTAKVHARSHSFSHHFCKMSSGRKIPPEASRLSSLMADYRLLFVCIYGLSVFSEFEAFQVQIWRGGQNHTARPVVVTSGRPRFLWSFPFTYMGERGVSHHSTLKFDGCNLPCLFWCSSIYTSSISSCRQPLKQTGNPLAGFGISTPKRN